MKGLVIKKNADLFSVQSESGVVKVKSRKNMKNDGIFVGDNVEFDEVIENIEPRKNLLIRPPLANVDKMFITIAPIPKPDFLLVDKMIVYCQMSKIKPYLLINKTDLDSDDFASKVKKFYKNVLPVLTTCAREEETKSLEKEISGICAFAGQSAVGKSSLINALKLEKSAIVGDLSKKIARGKQTTRTVQLYKTKNGYIADTAGFSMLSLPLISKIKEAELGGYYPDFLPYKKNCKFRSCLHQKEKECGIIEAVKDGRIPEERYQNYLKILTEISASRKY